MTLRQDQQQPLTRRQLREMERVAAAGEQQVPPVLLPFSASPVEAKEQVEPEEPVDAGEQLGSPAIVPAPSTEAPAVPLTRRQLRAMQQAGAAQAAAPAAPITAVPIAPEQGSAASVSTPAVIDEAPVPAASMAVAPEAPEVIDEAPVEPAQPDFRPPAGHWSLGTDESLDATGTSGAISSTNSLILPTIPSAADMTGPLNATGEILLTGSIDLPRGLGSTGQIHGRFDGADIDRMLDQHDRDGAVDSSVEPVAATRAISTHAPSVAPTIVPPKKTSHKVGAVAGYVGGGVAALAVAGVLVAGFIFHAF